MEAKIEAELNKFRDQQKEYKKFATARQQYEQQLSENQMVLEVR